jgi:2-haloacid dehalogenase
MPRAVCFDMYGTLCDTGSVTDRLGETLEVSDALAEAIDATWRGRQLQYASQVALMGDYEPFWTLTRRALGYALERYGVAADEETRAAVLAAYDHLEPYPDAAGTLERLRAAGRTVVVLSNGNPAMLSRLAENAGLSPHLDGLLSADAAGTFKPSPAVYERAAAELDRDVGDCRLVSANGWDVAGAGAAGMATAWVNRARDPPERLGPAPDLTAASLSAVADDLI